MDTVAINKARLVYYGFFASLFAFEMTEEDYHNVMNSADLLAASPIDEQSEKAFANIRRRLAKGGFDALWKESNTIFYSPLVEPVPMTASFFAEGRDDGRKRVEMVDFVLQSTFRRDSTRYRENEDHIEFVMLFIQKLIEQELAGDEKAGGLARDVFANILNPMLDPFGDALFNNEQSFLYKQVVLALRSFVELERLYLDVGTPVPSQWDKAASGAARALEVEGEEKSGGCIRMNSSSCV